MRPALCVSTDQLGVTAQGGGFRHPSRALSGMAGPGSWRGAGWAWLSEGWTGWVTRSHLTCLAGLQALCPVPEWRRVGGTGPSPALSHGQEGRPVLPNQAPGPASPWASREKGGPAFNTPTARSGLPVQETREATQPRPGQESAFTGSLVSPEAARHPFFSQAFPFPRGRFRNQKKTMSVCGRAPTRLLPGKGRVGTDCARGRQVPRASQDPPSHRIPAKVPHSPRARAAAREEAGPSRCLCRGWSAGAAFTPMLGQRGPAGCTPPSALLSSVKTGAWG